MELVLASAAAALFDDSISSRISLRRMAMERGAVIPIFTESPSIFVMAISMSSPIFMAWSIFLERISISSIPLAWNYLGLVLADLDHVASRVLLVVADDALLGHQGLAIDDNRTDEIQGNLA